MVGQAHQKLSRGRCRGEWINSGDLITWREDGSDSLKARLATPSPTSLITHPGSCQKPLVLPPLPSPWSSQMAPTCLAHTGCFLSALPAQPCRGGPWCSQNRFPEPRAGLNLCVSPSSGDQCCTDIRNPRMETGEGSHFCHTHLLPEPLPRVDF